MSINARCLAPHQSLPITPALPYTPAGALAMLWRYLGPLVAGSMVLLGLGCDGQVQHLSRVPPSQARPPGARPSPRVILSTGKRLDVQGIVLVERVEGLLGPGDRPAPALVVSSLQVLLLAQLYGLSLRDHLVIYDDETRSLGAWVPIPLPSSTGQGFSTTT